MLERTYQRALIVELKHRFPGCIILKNDANYLQGFPDILILHHDKWAALEVKASMNSAEQANQRYYVELLANMSFAAFICPENEEEVLDALQRSMGSRPRVRQISSVDRGPSSKSRN